MIGRLHKAEQFFEVAQLIRNDGEYADTFVSLCVLAGIAAADVLCCHALGKHAQGQSHPEAVQLLDQVKPDGKTLGHSLQVLVNFKSQAEYSSEPMSGDKRKRAQHAAEKLLQAARDRASE
jgi:hypothetical protein